MRITQAFILALVLVFVIAKDDEYQLPGKQTWVKRLQEVLDKEDAREMHEARRHLLDQKDEREMHEARRYPTEKEDELLQALDEARREPTEKEDELSRALDEARRQPIAKEDEASDEQYEARRLSFEDELTQALDEARRNHQQENSNGKDDEVYSNRRNQNDDMDDEYLELSARAASKTTNTGPVITLQNRALMNTRLRVLYTDANCSPFIAETGRIMIAQTKSVTLPSFAKNIKIIAEKDMLAENWRTVYSGSLTDASQCIRITGVTFKSTIKPCK